MSTVLFIEKMLGGQTSWKEAALTSPTFQMGAETQRDDKLKIKKLGS